MTGWDEEDKCKSESHFYYTPLQYYYSDITFKSCSRHSYPERLRLFWDILSQLCSITSWSYSLLVLDGVVAGVTHSHLELKAHHRVCSALGTTLPTHRFATLPAVVLKQETRGSNNKDGSLLVPVFLCAYISTTTIESQGYLYYSNGYTRGCLPSHLPKPNGLRVPHQH